MASRGVFLGLMLGLASCAPSSTPPAHEGVPPTSTSASPVASTATPAASSAPPASGAASSAASVASAVPAPEAPAQVVDARGCIVDPVTHAAQFVIDHHAAQVTERLGSAPTVASLKGKQGCLSRQEMPDIDGDGSAEVVVFEGCSWGSYASLQMIYTSNKGCSKFLGGIVDGELAARETKGAGLRDLEARWSNGCAGNDFAWTHYRWDGKAYKSIDKASCYFCAESTNGPRPPQANKHPYCKAEAKKRAAEPR